MQTVCNITQLIKKKEKAGEFNNKNVYTRPESGSYFWPNKPKPKIHIENYKIRGFSAFK